MGNMWVVYKVHVQETKHGRLCKCDAAAWLFMAMSTWALFGLVWFQSHT